ncbi:DNA recombination protein RmuC [Aquimarina agarilytica]|uniref:DNA recombination protein RmuC n=1 Tax=Aquimarina agarilytica TaxID=1087449 RepID=UPI000289A6D7|nr:DNA recombination protein RmuC [Aquimarina agarilytica]
MQQEIILLIGIFLALIVGFFIGKYTSGLRQKNWQSASENQLKIIQQQLASEQLLLAEAEKKHTNAIADLEEKHTHILHSLDEKFNTEKRELIEEREAIRRQKEFLNTELTRKNAEFDNLALRNQEQKKETEQLQEKFTKEFENLANKILDEKSSKFTEQNKENIKNILTPLQERITTFEKKVEETHKENIITNASLKEQILGLKDLNAQMSKEATNLTKALKGDNKVQGNWGELVLERVLEKSGLEKDREYFVQQNFTREDGTRALPDVIILLPDGKRIIIDSKVTLIAYERFINEDEQELKEVYLKEHINSLKKHVDQLSAKNYQDLYDIESLDFVLLFVPIETAFSVAINKENSLYNQAFEKNIVIVTPSTLLATLRTIDTMWSNEKQQRNALDIAKQAGSLYDKFEGLIKDLTGIGKKIDDTKRDYSAAMNKLVTGRGNLITSVEKLKKMGAKAKKALPENIIARANDEDI